MANKSRIIVTVFMLSGIGSICPAQKVTAQTQAQKDKLAFDARIEGLSERCAAKVREAHELTRLKRYVAAEAACKAAIDMCSIAPSLQDGYREELAFVYMCEGNYGDVLQILEPTYRPTRRSYDIVSWMAIAYARTNRASKGAQVLRDFAKSSTGIFFAPTLSDLPVAESEKADYVEASALLIWGWLNSGPKHPEDSIERLQRAAKLAPQNPAVNFALARRLDTQRDWKGALPHYLIAYAGGNEEIRKASGYRLERHDVKLDAIPSKGSGKSY